MAASASPHVKVAVNARPLLAPVTGVSRYLISLMREIERARRYEPEYFYVTHWSGVLDQRFARTVSPSLMRVVRSIGALRPLARAAQRRKFAAGVRRGGFALYFEPNYLPLESELPTVITIHDLSHLRHPETHPAARVRDLDAHLPAAVEKAHGILTVSEFTRREVIDVFGADPSRVAATPLGVEPRFHPRARSETLAPLSALRLAHGRYFLAVGTLEPRKNLATTIDAYARLPQRVRGAYPLVVVGMAGWRTDAIMRRIAAVRATDDVRLLGYVDDDALPVLYAGAAMLAYPSLYEGFGLPPLEAMASGVPVAVADRASLPEVVGDAGIVVDPHDVEGLAAAMQRVVDDAAFARRLAAAGLARARTFSWERCAALTMNAWNAALSTVAR